MSVIDLEKTSIIFPTKTLPHGVKVWSLHDNVDHRGSLTEIFRQEWVNTPTPVQWNFVQSKANVLRGMHVHLIHHDYYILLQGQDSIGLKDLRLHSPTRGVSALLSLNALEKIIAVSIPPGVAHGFYAHTSVLKLVGVSQYYDVEDELDCHWQDPELKIAWPCTNPIISPRDSNAPSLKTLLAQMQDWQASVKL